MGQHALQYPRSSRGRHRASGSSFNFSKYLPSREKLVAFGLKTGVVLGLGAAAFAGTKMIHDSMTAPTPSLNIERAEGRTSVSSEAFEEFKGDVVDNAVGNFKGFVGGMGLLGVAGIVTLGMTARTLSRNTPEEISGVPSLSAITNTTPEIYEEPYPVNLERELEAELIAMQASVFEQVPA